MSHAAGFASRPCMYYVASSLASRDGTHAHCSMNIECGVYSRVATIRSAAFIRGLLLLNLMDVTSGVYSRAATI